MAVTAYVGLGSNLGDRAALLQASLSILDCQPGVDVVAASPFHETEPVGYADQPAFLNAVAAVATTLSAHDLLARLHALEDALGRTRDGPRFGPRRVDLDLLLYG